MSQITKLIDNLCPNGVVYRTFSQIGTIRRGKRFVHADSVEEGIPCVHYGELYTHYGVWTTTTKSFIRNELKEKMRYANTNDVIIVGAGENDEDIGIGVAYLGSEPVAVHDACYIFSHNENPKYISYFLRTQDYHQQIKKYVKIGKICSISASTVENTLLPVPPRAIQDEIVRILDEYSEKNAQLIGALKAELEARKVQYEYYSPKVFENSETKNALLGDLATIKTGKKPDKILEYETEYEYINAGTSKSGYAETPNCVGDTVTTPSRGQGGIGFVGYQANPFCLGPLCYSIRSRNQDVVLNQYLYYYLKTFNYKILHFKKEGGTPSVNASDLVSITVNFPSTEKQRAIVSLLKQYEDSMAQYTEKIQCEIQLRQTQYEYYRDKLLTFQEAN